LFSAEGAKYDSQGRSPWIRRHTLNGALKGRSNRTESPCLTTPLQGLLLGCNRSSQGVALGYPTPPPFDRLTAGFRGFENSDREPQTRSVSSATLSRCGSLSHPLAAAILLLVLGTTLLRAAPEPNPIRSRLQAAYDALPPQVQRTLGPLDGIRITRTLPSWVVSQIQFTDAHPTGRTVVNRYFLAERTVPLAEISGALAHESNHRSKFFERLALTHSYTEAREYMRMTESLQERLAIEFEKSLGFRSKIYKYLPTTTPDGGEGRIRRLSPEVEVRIQTRMQADVARTPAARTGRGVVQGHLTGVPIFLASFLLKEIFMSLEDVEIRGSGREVVLRAAAPFATREFWTSFAAFSTGAIATDWALTFARWGRIPTLLPYLGTWTPRYLTGFGRWLPPLFVGMLLANWATGQLTPQRLVTQGIGFGAPLAGLFVADIGIRRALYPALFARLGAPAIAAILAFEVVKFALVLYASEKLEAVLYQSWFGADPEPRSVRSSHTLFPNSESLGVLPVLHGLSLE